MLGVGSPTIAVRQRRKLQEQQHAEGEAAFERQEGIAFVTALAGPGFVPCSRSGCGQRHMNTFYCSRCGLGFCSQHCADQEWEVEMQQLEQHIDVASLPSETFDVLDPTILALLCARRSPGWKIESLIHAIAACREKKHHAGVLAANQVEQASGAEVMKGIAEKFAQQPELHRTSLAQRQPELNACYKAAHHIFPGAWAAAWDAAHAAGLGQDAIHFAFRNPRCILRRDALGSDAACSQHSDFLHFIIVFPDATASRLWKAYEALEESVEVVSWSNHLANNDVARAGLQRRDGLPLAIDIECCLDEHLFQIGFCFSAFKEIHSPIFGFTSEWLHLLHAFETWSTQLVTKALLLGLELPAVTNSMENRQTECVTQWRQGQAEGEGTFWAADGSVYEGEWNAGRQHGHGKYWVRDGGAYDGEWQCGKHHGQGIHWAADGGVYRGEYVEGKRNGHGLYWFPTGCTYRGQWNNGKQDGHGVFWFASGGVYDGGWSMGKRTGHGTYWFPDGAAQTGEYLADVRQPGGQYWFADGRVQVTDAEEKGVCWSADRSLAWRVVGFAGKNVVHESISVSDAEVLAEELGLAARPPTQAPERVMTPPVPPERWLGRPPER